MEDPPPRFIRATSDASSPVELAPQSGLRPVPPNTKVVVLGGGSFGLAMASIPARKVRAPCVVSVGVCGWTCP